MSRQNLTPTDDTYVTDNNPGPNSTSTTLIFGGLNDFLFCYLKFPITNIPTGATITSATFNIYVSVATPINTNCQIKKLTSNWSGTTLTTSNLPTAAATIYATLPSTTSTGWKSVDIINLVNEWFSGSSTNIGLQIQPISQTISDGRFYSSKGVNVPYIAVDYTEPTTQSTGFSRRIKKIRLDMGL